jgi:hypothetical protein
MSASRTDGSSSTIAITGFFGIPAFDLGFKSNLAAQPPNAHCTWVGFDWTCGEGG